MGYLIFSRHSGRSFEERKNEDPGIPPKQRGGATQYDLFPLRSRNLIVLPAQATIPRLIFPVICIPRLSFTYKLFIYNALYQNFK
jgi:hypothetical protein